MMIRVLVGFGVVMSLLAPASAMDGAASRARKCAAGKVKAARKKAAAKLKCHETALKKAKAVAQTCLAGAEGRFVTAFARAEARGGCVTTGDQAVVEDQVDAFVAGIIATLSSGGSATTTTTVSPSTTTIGTTSTTPTPTSTTTTLACGGLFPSCAGSCSAGLSCKPITPIPASPCLCLP